MGPPSAVRMALKLLTKLRLGCQPPEHTTKWLWTYNNERPNTGIGGITPVQKLTMAA